VRTRLHLRLLTPLLAAAALVAVAAAPAAAADPDTEKPTTPTNVVAAFAGTTLTLTWDASTDDVGVVSYAVSQAWLDMVQMRTTTTNSITITGLLPSWTYRYYIAARDAAGNTSPSGASITVTVPPGDSQAPTAPTGVRASNASATSILLQWTPSRDNVYVDHYEVIRRTDVAETVVARTTGMTGGHQPIVTVARLVPDTEYVLLVRAHDTLGNISELSTPITVRTLPTTPACTVSYRITSKWDTGFLAEVVIRNQLAAPVNTWKLGWSFANGQQIRSIWDARLISGDSASVEVAQPVWGETIPAEGTATFGFVGSSMILNPAPGAFTLNGTACSVA
jgi:cellulose 1,4-beta-cellobiosidase